MKVEVYLEDAAGNRTEYCPAADAELVFSNELYAWALAEEAARRIIFAGTEIGGIPAGVSGDCLYLETDSDIAENLASESGLSYSKEYARMLLFFDREALELYNANLTDGLGSVFRMNAAVSASAEPLAESAGAIAEKRGVFGTLAVVGAAAAAAFQALRN